MASGGDLSVASSLSAQCAEQPQPRADSSTSFISIEGRGGDPNGHPSSPSKLSDELARRLAVTDVNPSQAQVRALPGLAGRACGPVIDAAEHQGHGAAGHGG